MTIKEYLAALKAAGFSLLVADYDEYDASGCWHIFIRPTGKNKYDSASRNFSGPELEGVFNDALDYAQKYDAYVRSAPGCHHT